MMKMWTWARFAPLVLATFLVSTIVGCGGGASYSTPQACFDAAKAAMKKEDFKAFCQCLTPESRDGFAAAMMASGMMMKAFAGMGGEEGKAAVAKIDEAFKKHGIDEKAISEPTPGADPKEEGKKLLAPIKDRDQFVADMMNAMKAMGKDKGEPPAMKLVEADLKDVKTEGDTASGTVAYKKDGADKSDPIKFKKVDGSWKIDMEAMGKSPV